MAIIGQTSDGILPIECQLHQTMVIIQTPTRTLPHVSLSHKIRKENHAPKYQWKQMMAVD